MVVLSQSNKWKSPIRKQSRWRGEIRATGWAGGVERTGRLINLSDNIILEKQQLQAMTFSNAMTKFQHLVLTEGENYEKERKHECLHIDK